VIISVRPSPSAAQARAGATEKIKDKDKVADKDKEVAVAVVAVSIDASCRRFRIIRAFPFNQSRLGSVQTYFDFPFFYPEPDGEF
jgi:hypothetical protein